jgi:hypothetical protein
MPTLKPRKRQHRSEMTYFSGNRRSYDRRQQESYGGGDQHEQRVLPLSRSLYSDHHADADGCGRQRRKGGNVSFAKRLFTPKVKKVLFFSFSRKGQLNFYLLQNDFFIQEICENK